MKYLSLVTLMVAASCSMTIAILLLTNYSYLAYNAGVAPVVTMTALLSISGVVLFIMFYKEWNRLFLK